MSKVQDPILEQASKVERDFKTGCWLWLGPKDRKGYGRTYYGGRNWSAHRLFYAAFKGFIFPGLQIDHLCRVRNCVNPNHLEAVTPRENNLRSPCVSTLNIGKPSCIHGHPFTKENTYIKPNGRRNCWTCKRLILARSRERKRIVLGMT